MTDPRPKVTHAAAARILAGRDPVIARLLAETGPPRLARPAETHFATLVRSSGPTGRWRPGTAGGPRISTRAPARAR